MKHALRQLYWKVFGRPDVPPKPFTLKQKYNMYTSKPYIPRWQEMAQLYLETDSTVEDIAVLYNVTRERVRQCLWKAYNDSHRNE